MDKKTFQELSKMTMSELIQMRKVCGPDWDLSDIPAYIRKRPVRQEVREAMEDLGERLEDN